MTNTTRNARRFEAEIGELIRNGRTIYYATLGPERVHVEHEDRAEIEAYVAADKGEPVFPAAAPEVPMSKRAGWTPRGPEARAKAEAKRARQFAEVLDRMLDTREAVAERERVLFVFPPHAVTAAALRYAAVKFGLEGGDFRSLREAVESHAVAFSLLGGALAACEGR